MSTAEVEQLKATIELLKVRLNAAELGVTSSETRIRTLIESLPVGLMICSDTGYIEAVNPQSLLMLGCEYSDLIGRHLSNVFISQNQQQQLFSDEKLKVISQDPFEVSAQSLSSEPFPAEILLRPFPFAATMKLLVVFEDMTLKHDLDRMKREFVQIVSHDLRAPITSIRCFLNALTEGLFDDRPEKMHKKAQAMESETTRLLTMINNLLDLEKMEAGAFSIIMEQTALFRILERSVEAISALAEQNSVSLDVELPEQNVVVSADGDLIVQVLVNLLSNAVKFSPAGKPVQISVELHGDYRKVIVTDQGPGMPEEFRKRMFSRFEQARLSDSRVKGGTGLGLAISKAIIEGHGGTIGVESKEGAGCSFWFTLPIMSAKS